MDLDAVRELFIERGLDERDLAVEPLTQFARWFAEVRDVGLHQPEAVVLATASGDGEPAARYVLHRGADDGGFRFFSDAESDKGRDLAANDRVALVFAWHAVGRQVRVRGRALPLADAEIDEYWASRPRESRIAAVASNQSCVVEGRRTLEARYAVVAEDAAEGPVERPDRWVGWRVEPTEVEFWQARAHRFHDRLRYRREPDSSEAADWIVERLQP